MSKAFKRVLEGFDSVSNIRIRKMLGTIDLPRSSFKFNSSGQIEGMTSVANATRKSIKRSSGLTAMLSKARKTATKTATKTGSGLSGAAKIAAKNKKIVSLAAGAAIFKIPGALEKILGKKDCSKLEGDELKECEEENARIDDMVGALRDPIAAAAKAAIDIQMYIYMAAAAIALLLIVWVLF